jgi:hypothetical protein
VEADWSQHGSKTLAQVRRTAPQTYLRVVASLVPARLDVGQVDDDFDHLSDEELQEELLRRSVSLLEGYGIPEAAAAIRKHLAKEASIFGVPKHPNKNA